MATVSRRAYAEMLGPMVGDRVRLVEDADVQGAIHTDTLNESGFVEDTIAAFKGRTIHTFHTEGDGHAPDILKVVGETNVLPSSTNPTRPYAVNPAIAHGIGHEVGSVEVGKWADLVPWRPAFFGVKPSLVLKGGFIALAAMGNPNASIPTPQPAHARPMFGAFGGALARGALTFLSRGAHDGGLHDALGLRKTVAAVKGCRGLGKRHMLLNDYAPSMRIDAQTYGVRADGVLLTCGPAAVLPMAQRYFLF